MASQKESFILIKVLPGVPNFFSFTLKLAQNPLLDKERQMIKEDIIMLTHMWWLWMFLLNRNPDEHNGIVNVGSQPNKRQLLGPSESHSEVVCDEVLLKVYTLKQL